MTNKQRELLRLIREQKKHLTAEEIFFIARNNGMAISLASIYRILNVLVEAKELRKVSNIYNVDAYDICVEDHEHLVCSICGKVSDIQINGFKQVLQEYVNVAIDNFDLCVHYVCDDCKKKKEGI